MSLADVIPLVFRDACYVAANIRQQDWDECRCQIEEENKFVLAQLCFFGTEEGLKWCARYRGQPVAAFGVINSGPSLYNLWFWATPRVIKVFPAVVKFLDVTLREQLISRGARRLEIRAYSGHDFVEKGWLLKAGALEVCDLPQYGKNGESFKLFAWWKGMPNEQDVRRGYDRVRSTDPVVVVPVRNEDEQLCNHGSDDYVGGSSLPIYVVSDCNDGRRGGHDGGRNPVELRITDDQHYAGHHSLRA